MIIEMVRVLTTPEVYQQLQADRLTHLLIKNIVI